MSHYNDGKWHGVVDGKKPEEVHEKSEIKWKNSAGLEATCLAGPCSWDGGGYAPIIAFKVIKEFVPLPAEIWGKSNCYIIREDNRYKPDYMKKNGWKLYREVVE